MSDQNQTTPSDEIACTRCDGRGGHGGVHGDWHDCPVCHGNGAVPVQQTTERWGPMACQRCGYNQPECTCIGGYVTPQTTQVARYRDAIDAHMHVNRWVEDLARRLPQGTGHIESYGLRLSDPTAQPNGGVTVVWGEAGKMAGVATIVRDEMNFSRLTIVEPADAVR